VIELHNFLRFSIPRPKKGADAYINRDADNMHFFKGYSHRVITLPSRLFHVGIHWKKLAKTAPAAFILLTGMHRTFLTIVVTLLLAVTAGTRAGVVLDFWHSYTPPSTGTRHHNFHLTNYKRGLFFGSCGISTRSLRWGYTFDLEGDGPVYSPGRVTVTDEDFRSLTVAAGTITIDEKKMTAIIDLAIEQAGTTNRFAGNGTYRIKKSK